jgi:hypothetical protein
MWSGPLGVAVLVVSLVGIAGLAYYVMRAPQVPLPPRGTDEPDTRDVERHTPRR